MSRNELDPRRRNRGHRTRDRHAATLMISLPSLPSLLARIGWNLRRLFGAA